MDNIHNIETKNFPEKGSLEEKIKFCLRYAVLAPSTHNTQPWLFKIEGNSVIILYDPKLKLPQADPTDRNLFMSIGKALENLLIASKYFGIFESVNYEFNESEHSVAKVFFRNDGERGLLFESLITSIPTRVNSRGPFLPKPIPNEILENLKKLFSEKYEKEGLFLNIITEREEIDKIARLTEQGMHIAHKNKKFRAEMSSWLRNSLTLKKDGMPGFSLRMPFWLSFLISTGVKYKDMGNFLGKLNYKSVSSASSIFIFSSEKRDPITWVKMGLAIERLSLELQSRNIKTSVYIASVEISDLYKQVQKMLGTNLIPQFAFCAGYMNFDQKVTPKHSLAEKLVK